MTSPVQTQGPVDPNAGFRAKLYAGLAVLTGVVSLVQSFGLINSDQGGNIGLIITGVGGLLGAGGLAVAASKTNAQTKNGTFDPAPPNPVANAVEGIKAVQSQWEELSSAVATGLGVVQGAASLIPGLSTVVAPGGLVDDFLHGAQHS